MTCECCVFGDHNLCGTGEGTTVRRHGGFAEKVKAVWAIPIPDSVDVISVGPLFCGGVTVFNLLVQFDIKSTDRVGVIGWLVGPYGFDFFKALRMRGDAVFF